MAAMWSIIWGIAVFVIMEVTFRYYVPKLYIRTQVCNLDSSPITQKKKYSSLLETNQIAANCILVGCMMFSALCGYSAAIHSNSLMGLIKMTIMMGVLSCIFITDMELMIIPNVCSAILIIGRLVSIIIEYIWIYENATSWLLNSVIAMLVSILLLLVMSKVTRGGIGMGDVKLFGGIGFLCGIQAVCYTLVFAFIICALFSTFLLLTKKKQLKDSLPLGPFVFLGYGVSVLISII